MTKFLPFSPRHYTINAKEAAQAGTARMLNSYIDDKTAIGALTEDFENYLRLCRPLMRIYNTASTAAFRALYLDFLRAPGGLYRPAQRALSRRCHVRQRN